MLIKFLGMLQLQVQPLASDGHNVRLYLLLICNGVSRVIDVILIFEHGDVLCQLLVV